MGNHRAACSPDRGLGRSRDGFTAKRHWAVEQDQTPVPIVNTSGQRSDSPQFEPALKGIRVPRVGPGRPRVLPDRVRADKGVRLPQKPLYLRRAGRRVVPGNAGQVRNRGKLGSLGGRPARLRLEDKSPRPTTATVGGAVSGPRVVAYRGPLDGDLRLASGNPGLRVRTGDRPARPLILRSLPCSAGRVDGDSYAHRLIEVSCGQSIELFPSPGRPCDTAWTPMRARRLDCAWRDDFTGALPRINRCSRHPAPTSWSRGETSNE